MHEKVIVFEYKQSIQEFARRTFFRASPVIIACLASLIIFWAELPFWGIAILILTGGLGFMVLVKFSILNIFKENYFSFIITKTEVRCHSPVNKEEGNFVVTLEDVDYILCKGNLSEGPPTYYFYLVNIDKTTVKIPTDYNNPVRKIVKTLKNIKPRLLVLDEKRHSIDI